MKHKFTALGITLWIMTAAYTQSVGIGTTTPAASAQLDVSSTSKGFLMPRMTTAQRSAIVNPATGLQIFNLDNQCADIFDGTAWITNCGYKQTDSITMPAEPWKRLADFGGAARFGASGFSIGNKGYIGTGSTAGITDQSDFWEFDVGTNAWTQKADYGGGAIQAASGFSIGAKGYIGTGNGKYSGYRKDFWEYEPVNNVWTQKANFGGSGRFNAVGFSIGNKGYIGTGQTLQSNQNDFWEYEPVNDLWTQKANFGGSVRNSAVGFSIGNKGYIGTGVGVAFPIPKNDFWEYDTGNNVWTQKADFGGATRYGATGFSIVNKGYIIDGVGPEYTYRNDFWEFDPGNNSWTRKTNFSGTGRQYAVGFSIGAEGYVGTGFGAGVYRNDFWVYNNQPKNATVYTSPYSNLEFVNDGTWSKAGLSVYKITGNVGIGTAPTDARLTVSDTSLSPQLKLYQGAGTDYARLRLTNANDNYNTRFWDIAG